MYLACSGVRSGGVQSDTRTLIHRVNSTTTFCIVIGYFTTTCFTVGKRRSSTWFTVITSYQFQIQLWLLFNRKGFVIINCFLYTISLYYLFCFGCKILVVNWNDVFQSRLIFRRCIATKEPAMTQYATGYITNWSSVTKCQAFVPSVCPTLKFAHFRFFSP